MIDNARLIELAPEMADTLLELAITHHARAIATPGSPCYNVPRSRCDNALCAHARALLARLEAPAAPATEEG